MFDVKYWGNLGKQSKAKIKPNDFKESDLERLTYFVYQSMLKEKEKDDYCSFGDKQSSEIYRLASEKASRAIQHYGGLVICGNCNTPKECTQCVPPHSTTPVIIKVPCMCSCRVEAEEARKAQIAEQDRQERREQVNYASGGARNEFERFTFANDDHQNPKITNFAKNYCKELLNAENGCALSGVMFYGVPGTGKTFIASCIANELTDHGYFCHITTVNAVLSRMWDEANREDYLKALKQYDLIVIDDFGAEHKSKSEYERDLLENLINELYRASKRLIITTNMKMTDFKQNLSIQEARMYDRLLTMCQYRIKVDGESRRTLELKQNYTATQKQIDEWMKG